MSYTILNDVHLGVRRQGGTTQASKRSLRYFLQENFAEAAAAASDNLIILGDLFDDFSVDLEELITAYSTLYNAFSDTDRKLYLVAGNHDWKPRDGDLSSFHALAALLPRDNVILIDKGLHCIEDGSVYVIPHMPNQDLFDLELQKALDVMHGGHLLLHANYDNNFAVQADHSLNVSAEWATKFRAQGVTLVFAHEHQKRSLLNVEVLGNQWPSSVSDCLPHGAGQRDGKKYLHVLDANGLTAYETWDGASEFARIDWQELGSYEGEAAFVRIEGDANAAQAEEVIETIARFRSASKAFVISNAVRVEGMPEMDGLMEIEADSIRGFDVMGALLAELEPEEAEVVKGLMSDD